MSNITMKNTYATFKDPEMAAKAGGALLDHGIDAGHISILLPERARSETREDVPGEQTVERIAETGITTTTMGDAASGSAKGAGIGLAAGAFAALAAVFIPGVGLVLGGGALALAIGGVAGTTAAGAIAGGVTGFLKDQGVPDDAIQYYHEVLVNGGAMITVSPTDERIDAATIESVLRKYGGSIASYSLGASAAVMVDGSPSTVTAAP
jgi:hypothetical protein